MYYVKSIRFRLTLWYLIVIMVLLACFGLSAYLMLSRQLHQNLNESLRTRAIELETGLKSGVENITYLHSDYLIFVYSDNGSITHRLGPDVNRIKTESLVQLAFLGEDSFATQSLQGQQVRIYITPMNLSVDTRLVLLIGKPLTEINQTLGMVRSVFIFSAFLALIFAALAGSSLATRALYPIRRMMGVAEEVGSANLGRRIEVHRNDELGNLASTLNRMMERLEAAFNREREFAADASHELRTPLTVIEAESTLALEKDRSVEEYKKSLEVISQEIDFMSTVLGGLLSIARNEAGKENLRMESINIRDILLEMSPKFEMLAHDKGLDYSLNIKEDQFVEGDKTKIKQLFSNIFDNAVKYTKTGSVSVTALNKDNLAIVNIIDTGIGIPSEHLPHIFERFYRVDRARSRAEGGTGLGLSIAKQIADSHGGKIEVRSDPGHGSIFSIYLPLNRSIQL